MFDIAHGLARLIRRDLSFEGVEGFGFFEGIFFGAGAEGLFENLMKIDENASAEDAIKLVFAGSVHTHQPLHGAGLVCAEMIDMHGHVGFSLERDAVDEPFEVLFFFFTVQGPALFVNCGARRIAGSHTSQILQAVFSDEGISLEIEKEVMRRGFRQPAKAHGFHDGQDRFADGEFFSRPSTWTRACSRTRSRPSREPCSGRFLMGMGMAASFATVWT